MKKYLKTIFLLLIVLHSYLATAQNIYQDKLAHTYSIVARDQNTGDMAVGVQSHWFSVGTIVSWGKSGIGVVATQSFVDPSYGPNGLDLMEEGIDAKEALQLLVSKDAGREVRQIAFLDANGRVAAHTGEKCIASASHIAGDNYSVQANMMLNENVVPAMAKAFEENAKLPLEERVLKVLMAAQEAGGDIRGKQSAVLIVVQGAKVEESWKDKKIDLRVDDHEKPLVELQRLLRVHKAYEYLNRGDLAMEHGDMEKALEEYATAEQLFPDNLEMRYWKAVTLANNQRIEEAIPIFKDIFKADDNWRILTKRLPASGLLNLSNTDLNKILNL